MHKHPTEATAALAEGRIWRTAGVLFIQILQVKLENLFKMQIINTLFIDSALIVWECQLLIMKGHLWTFYSFVCTQNAEYT